ncbi:hypothetical protein K435DRAFT_798372 [Dendrothele bispora CBS 962.96]|uniref:Winged helix-turn helix domain-containing protein n=1 Tax=Dendrothele bispora (strain CBS 962.96) TaxID=1314807 RepID=A0A4S8LZG6_DENBC|nr:hypothetical protein K435DRAFT_798372 [Dendrothele bispora CBS 962.96]
MVFRHISEDIKRQALWLLENGYITREVAYLLGVSSKSIRRWQNNFDIHGSVVAPANPLQGRPSDVTTELREDLISLTRESPELFLDEIQDWIAVAHEAAISRSHLWQILDDCAITYKKLRREASERDEALREQWKAAYQQHYTASQILFIDETSKDDRTIYRHYGRSVLGERATIAANFVRGERWSMVAALGVEGYSAVRVVPGSVDGDEFFDFIVVDVVSFNLNSML